MSIEKKLSALFDYQKFEGNKELEAIINSNRNAVKELSDDDLDMVSAAGVVDSSLKTEETDENEIEIYRKVRW